MTEFWKSNPNFWCEYCKVWLKDTQQSRATHERGVKHRENVARKLSEMRKQADQEKVQEKEAASTMSAIEAAAQRQYEKDAAEAAAHRQRTLGTWELKRETGYYYNAVQRYYYDPKTGMYYGGEPVDWTESPKIPRDAHYEAMTGTAPTAAPKAAPGAAAAAARTAPPASTSGRPAAAAAVAPRGTAVVAPGSRAVASHPLASIGGYQMPDVGRIGGAKGVGLVSKGPAAEEAAAKRKREAATGSKPGGKAMSAEEAEALARREAAKARVQARTMASFGLL